jgi:multidrug efflux system membrane fusion protein
MTWLVLGMTALAGTTALTACSKSETPGAKAEGRVPGVSVVVAQVTARDVPVRVRAIGNVQASATVSVLAQIGGEITKIHFKEGQDVATGDLLFTIDPRTFEAALQQARAQLAQHQAQVTQAEANLARDKAQHDNAVVEEDRYRRLVDGGMIAREQYDQIRTNELSLASTIKADGGSAARAVVQADEGRGWRTRRGLHTGVRSPSAKPAMSCFTGAMSWKPMTSAIRWS